jgi:hypothetical protein
MITLSDDQRAQRSHAFYDAMKYMDGLGTQLSILQKQLEERRAGLKQVFAMAEDGNNHAKPYAVVIGAMNDVEQTIKVLSRAHGEDSALALFNSFEH